MSEGRERRRDGPSDQLLPTLHRRCLPKDTDTLPPPRASAPLPQVEDAAANDGRERRRAVDADPAAQLLLEAVAAMNCLRSGGGVVLRRT
jgi:hypothetical protein